MRIWLMASRNWPWSSLRRPLRSIPKIRPSKRVSRSPNSVRGKSQEGLTQLEQVFANEAGETIAGPTLVLSESRAGRIKKASEVAASLIRLDANNPLCQTLLGVVDVAQRDYPAAEAAFPAALARNPEFVAAIRNLSQLYVVSGRTEDAKKVYGDLLSKRANARTSGDRDCRQEMVRGDQLS